MGREWRTDSALVTIGGVKHRRAVVIYDGETVRVLTRRGELVTELTGAMRVPTAPNAWEFRSNGTVIGVKIGGCGSCGGRR